MTGPGFYIADAMGEPSAPGSRVTALLGPTNTGKTHRALERMLEHDTGAIGVPLRLLAREVYDKLTRRVGERAVALVTGEEKRVPAAPRYWVATVEAMPTDLAVDFLAIDEIQLAEHDQRGHVFTDRLLHARGRKETWFLGAETMRPMFARLLPDAEISRLPRLSRLTFAGASTLSQVPPRSAVVAFSMEKVFELAEKLRAKKGGAAVVLGLLSPRARNAQVAMYQAGEVDYLVATDAIGMGLNLDVRHVAFAALRKFDGRDARALDAAEIGQIAGRAGRHTKDGTFGTLAPLELPRDLARAVEHHAFAPVEAIRWRNVDLDFSSIAALTLSLKRRSPMAGLRLDAEGEDLAALVALGRIDEVASRATEQARVQLLWDVCRVPDYRKLLFESHVALLAAIYVQLVDRGTIDLAWADERVRELDDPDGDIETLTARLSAVRTWAYLSHQGQWLAHAHRWQARTREIEDRLSDALHDRLVARFVERKQKVVASASTPLPTKKVSRVDPKHPFAALAAMNLPGVSTTTDHGGLDVEALVDAPAGALRVDGEGRMFFGATLVARMVRGPTLLAPDVRGVGLDDLGGGARVRVMRRLSAHARDVVDELVGPIRRLFPRLSPAARGLAYQLEQSLGSIASASAAVQLAALNDDDRAAFAEAGVTLGGAACFRSEGLTAAAIARRALLVALFWDARERPGAPNGRPPSLAVSRRVDPRAAAAIGYPVYAIRAVRADLAESLCRAASEGHPYDERELARRIGCPRPEAARVFAAIAAAVGGATAPATRSGPNDAPPHASPPSTKSTPPRD
jgi:ATP-dependent RNA helicase SUPV3L1/SUV3